MTYVDVDDGCTITRTATYRSPSALLMHSHRTAMAQPLAGHVVSLRIIIIARCHLVDWAPDSWHPHLSRAASGAPDASHVLESTRRPPCSIASCPASREPASGASSTRRPRASSPAATACCRVGKKNSAIELQCAKRSLWRAAASFQGSLRPPRLGALAIATGTPAQTQETESPTSSSSSSSLPPPALSYFKARATCCERRRNLYFEESLARRAPWRTPRRRCKTTSRQWWIS